MKVDQLSKTAAFVAVKFFGLTRIKTFRSLFDDSVISFYDQLVQSLPAPMRYYHFWLQFKTIRKLYIWSEELLLPGDLLHIVARKWYIQRMTEKLLEDDYEQLIVLGAGFDHLGYYYANKGLPCFEFDTPRMATIKKRFLNSCYPNDSHPKTIPLHLSSNHIGTRLSERNIDPQKKTIIVAEGFFDYLDLRTVSTLLCQTKDYFSHNPALLCTHFALDELPTVYRWVFKKSIKLVGEQLQLYAPIYDFKQLIRKEGFTIRQCFDNQQISGELHQRIKTKFDVLQGFYILMAS